MTRNKFQSLSTKDLQAINGGQARPIIVHTFGILSEEQIRKSYPPGTALIIVR